MKSAMLVLLDAEENRNAQLTMRQKDTRLFDAEFSRVGADPYTMTYPMHRWDAILEKHLAKGFVVRADGNSSKNNMYLPIADPQVRRLIDVLTKSSRKYIQQFYQISPSLVTQGMVEHAQALIKALAASESVEEANDHLKNLAVVIPRRLFDVQKDLLLPNIQDLEIVASREQELLDIMASEVEVESRQQPDRTILDAYGLSIRPCSEKEEAQIRQKMQSCAKYFHRAYRVRNKVTDKRFETYCETHQIKTVRYLYHGSTTPNWFSLISQGMKLNPDAPITGKMFGYGLYFADDAHKSLGYTSLAGSKWAGGRERKAYMAVSKVAYKNPLHTDETNYKLSQMTAESIRPHDAVFAHKGKQLLKNEIIVYTEAQATWQYLIELKEG